MFALRFTISRKTHKMKSNSFFLRLSIFLCLAFLGTQNLFAQKEKFLLDECYNFHHRMNEGWSSNLFWDMVIADDFVLKGGGGSTDQAQLGELDDFQQTAKSGTPYAIWKVYYNGIEKTNQALKFIPNVTGNETYRAEAKFIRAFCYFSLVRLFGGVPIITDDCATEKMSLVRATTTEVYAQIEKDLSEAIPVLPVKSALGASENYKATKGAAHAVFAQACLYQQKWSEAAAHLEAIINSNEYSLMPNFSDLWLQQNEHNKESIFEFEYYSNKGYTWGNFDWNHPESNLYMQLFGPRDVSNSEFGAGWGFGCVTKKLVDLFDAHNDKIRKAATILKLTDIAPTQANGYEQTGYQGKKYTTRLSNTSSANGDTPELNFGQNIVVIRYAEILLMYAEVQARLGNTQRALMNLNMIRNRAGLNSFNNISNQAALLDSIFSENTLEFALEGKRFFDVVRWGKAHELLAPLGYDDYESLWPIPAAIISENPLLTQNPGYAGEQVPPINDYSQANNYAPVVAYPWIKNAETIKKPTVRKQYKYNQCMSDSALLTQADYTYNSKGLVTDYVQSGFFNNVKQAFYKETYAYDQNDRLVKSFNLKNTNNKWDTLHVSIYKYPTLNTIVDSLIYFYSGTRNNISVRHYNWDEQKSRYITITDSYSYNSNSILYKQNFVDTTTNVLEYNADNQITIQHISSKNGALSESRYTYSNGLLTRYESFNIYNNLYTKQNQTDYVYKNRLLDSISNSLLINNIFGVYEGTKCSHGALDSTVVYEPLQYLSLTNNLQSTKSRTFFTFDVTSPTAYIASSAGTGAVKEKFNITIYFSKDVLGFDVSDLSIANGNASNFQAISASVYKVDITPTASGNVTIMIAAGKAKDLKSNPNKESNKLVVVSDLTIPTTTITRTTGNGAVKDKFNLTITFSKDVSGFDISDLTVANGTASSFEAVSAKIYTVDILPIVSGDVSVSVASDRAKDSLSNANTASNTLVVVYAKNITSVNFVVTVSGKTSTVSVPSSNFQDFGLTGTVTYTATLSDGSPLPSWITFNPQDLTFTINLDSKKSLLALEDIVVVIHAKDQNGKTGAVQTTLTKSFMTPVDELTIKSIQIVPNPATDYISVETDDINSVYTINDLNGKVSLTGKIETKKQIIQISQLASGIYIMHINAKDKVFIGKFIKN